MGRLLNAAGPFLIVAGAIHFVRPEVYDPAMPPWLPAKRELNLAAGVAEAASGLALMAPSPKLRRLGGRLGVATMVGVFPANFYMWQERNGRFKHLPGAALAARLPVQAVFIAWFNAAGKRA